MAFLDTRGHHLLAYTLDDLAWVEALPGLAADARLRRLEIRLVNGVPVRSSPVAAALDAAGFVPTPRGLVVRG